MQLGMIGVGRMGANMTRRLLAGVHCWIYDVDSDSVSRVAGHGSKATASPREMASSSLAPLSLLLVPAAS